MTKPDVARLGSTGHDWTRLHSTGLDFSNGFGLHLGLGKPTTIGRETAILKIGTLGAFSPAPSAITYHMLLPFSPTVQYSP